MIVGIQIVMNKRISSESQSLPSCDWFTTCNDIRRDAGMKSRNEGNFSVYQRMSEERDAKKAKDGLTGTILELNTAKGERCVESMRLERHRTQGKDKREGKGLENFCEAARIEMWLDNSAGEIRAKKGSLFYCE